jgi:hypothetical protein
MSISTHDQTSCNPTIVQYSQGWCCSLSFWINPLLCERCCYSFLEDIIKGIRCDCCCGISLSFLFKCRRRIIGGNAILLQDHTMRRRERRRCIIEGKRKCSDITCRDNFQRTHVQILHTHHIRIAYILYKVRTDVCW